VAKADGQVDAREIALAEALMRQMQLDADRRRAAIARFSAGKEPDFDLDGALEQVRAASTRQPKPEALAPAVKHRSKRWKPPMTCWVLTPQMAAKPSRGLGDA